MQTEEWRTIEGFPDYQVSNLGRVVSHKRPAPRLLSFSPSRIGHQNVVLLRDGIKTHHRVHSLVAAAFIGPRPPGADVRHLDGNPGNNRFTNLVYGTRSENNYDSVRHGTHGNARKEECPQGHPYDEENTYRWGGHRYCRSCAREKARISYAKARDRRSSAPAG